MINTNYFSSIVKILENPITTITPKNIRITKLRVEIPQIRKNKLIYVIFYGNLAENIQNYYEVNDYILIEGYLSIKKNLKTDISKKKIEVHGLKVSPLYLKSN